MARIRNLILDRKTGTGVYKENMEISGVPFSDKEVK